MKKDKKKVPGQKFATLDSLQQESSSDEEEGDYIFLLENKFIYSNCFIIFTVSDSDNCPLYLHELMRFSHNSEQIFSN